MTVSDIPAYVEVKQQIKQLSECNPYSQLMFLHTYFLL